MKFNQQMRENIIDENNPSRGKRKISFHCDLTSLENRNDDDDDNNHNDDVFCSWNQLEENSLDKEIHMPMIMSCN